MAAAAVLVAACGDGEGDGDGSEVTTPTTTTPAVVPTEPATTAAPENTAAALTQPEAVASGLEAPWGLAFLPDGSVLVSERDRARVLQLPPGGGEPREVARIDGVDTTEEGGLLGIAVAPTYEQDRLVYAYYTAGGDNRVVRFQLGGEPEVVIDGIPKNVIHNGGRIAFGPDGMLYVTTGDARQPSRAQDPGSLGGKILRLNPDGSVPADNPTAGSPVYTLGHRNVQGLAWDDQGRLWASELGQDAWDEVNLIEPGANYGWPQVEGQGGGAGFTDPQIVWPTSESSPSGAAFADGSLYVAALRGTRLWRIPINPQGGAEDSEPLLVGEYGRLRHAAVGPDGNLWLLTSNRDGRGNPSPEDDRVIRRPLP